MEGERKETEILEEESGHGVVYFNQKGCREEVLGNEGT